MSTPESPTTFDNSSEPTPVIVGIDGSDGSAAALQWAASLAGTLGQPLQAVAAWNYPASLMMPAIGAPGLPSDHFAQMAAAKLEATVGATPTTPAPEQRVIMGSPRVVLSELSERAEAIVIGRTGTGRISRLVVGSTASYCVRHAECPVAIVDDAVSMESQVTVAVDGSPSSIDALVWALGLGDDRAIRAVYSHDEWELDQLGLESALRTELEERAATVLAETVETACAKVGASLDRVTAEVLSGDPRTTVVDHGDPDALLVLGAQGHSGVARWLLGSLADYAVHHAPGSLVIVR